MNFALRHLKKMTLAGCIIVGISVAGQALAQDCQINLSESNMDFGRVIPPGSNDTLNAGNIHALGNRIISLNASCPKASKLMLVLRGETHGEQFKFAQTGQVRVRLSNALLDGRSVDLAQTKSVGAAPSAYGQSIEAVPGDMVIPVSGGQPAVGLVLSVQIEIRPLVPVSELRTRDAKTLEANLSFQVRSY
ncbi:MAG: hypothetical protein ACOH2P_17110 [Pseudomonas sp.]